jgi:hypothetical protein
MCNAETIHGLLLISIKKTFRIKSFSYLKIMENEPIRTLSEKALCFRQYVHGIGLN